MPEWSATGASAHPDLETLAAYVDGTLDPRTRETITQHVGQCDDCHELVAEVLRTEEILEEETSVMPASAVVVPPKKDGQGNTATQRRFGPRELAIGGGVLALAASLVLVVWIGRTGTDEQFDRLIAAAGTERTVEARLSGGFPHRELRSPLRSGARTDNYPLLAAAGELQVLAKEDPSPESLHAWGVAQLLVGQIDGAVSTLSAVAQDAPSNAGALSDLAAALLARAQTLDRSEDVPRALDAAERSLKLDPNRPEALFNRALALEQMGLRDQAIAAWRQSLAIEPDAAWRAEMEARIRRLESGS